MEADSLRWSLLVIGSLVIVGLAVHGIWLSRKNNENKTKKTKKAKKDNHKKAHQYQPASREPAINGHDDELDSVVEDTSDSTNRNLNINFNSGRDEVISKPIHTELQDKSQEDGYDNLGLGTVRVVFNEPKADAEAKAKQDLSEETVVKPEASSRKIYASVVTRPKPEYDPSAAANSSISRQAITASSNIYRSDNHYQAPEPPPFLLKKQAPQPEEKSELDNVIAEQNKARQSLSTQDSESKNTDEPVRDTQVDAANQRIEPKINEERVHNSFEQQQTVKLEPKADFKEELKEELKTKSVKLEQPQEVLVLNVKSADDNPILGSALLPMLLTLGFKFGEQDIFHRHVNTNGKGPVLFSLANMFKPGNFDIDSLENFTTGGISLFMILPIEGEPRHVFNMMHNAARKIADEFSAHIYDDKRALLTKQGVQRYIERIREFERQRTLGS